MLLNHVRIAFRNILKQKGYNSLNVIGLATGIAAGLLIALHLQEELSYEKKFEHYQNIYRIHSDQWAKSCPPLAIQMKERLPDIESVGRLASYGTRVVNTDDNNPGEVTGYYADSTVLDVFGFTVVAGDRKQALAGVRTAVITQSMAKRYFGNQDPIGKLLRFDNGQEFPVTAVLADLPGNSHIRFDYLISMPTFYKDVPERWTNNRGWMVMYTYVRFKSDQGYAKTVGLMPKFMHDFYEGWENRDEMVATEALRFQPLKDIHLRSKMEQEMSANSNIIYVYIFIAVEILILVVACANFMSLFTTQAIKRMKEVGMRKILGARPGQLMVQFLTEVILLTLTSLVLSIVLYQLALPVYNDLARKSLGIWQVFEKDNLLIIAAILMGVVSVSGLYPAFFISGFKASSFLQENKLPSSMPNLVRNSLVIFQFTVSISLIAATILVHQQMNLLQNKDLGFDKDQVVNIKLYGSLWSKATSETDVFKHEFLKNANVLAVGRVGSLIGEDLSVEGVVPEGREQEANTIPSVRVLRVDEDYLTAMSIPLAAGRNFSRTLNDSASFIINETAAKTLGLQEPVDQRLNNMTMNKKGKIVGVVKDYHFASLHNTVEPLVMEWRPDWTGYLTIKMKSGKTTETMEYIRTTVNKIAPGSLFVYNFLDDHLDALYKSENAMGKVFEFFSVLAIIIACLGLLGLSAYTIESRTKEIGIRKVLGASVAGIVALVTSRFFVLVSIAFVIAVPLTWYGMYRWLQNFAYQIDIHSWVFVLTGLIIAATATLAVGFNTIKAAVRNPVTSLRYE